MVNINDIKKRIYRTIPIGSLYMNELLSILNIRLSDNETESACVTCSIKPELILNPHFIEKYCKSDEHLLMLIMHELYHIILGHTKLYPNHTIIDNIAFDAIINAILCRMFPGEEYTSFFKNLNSEKSFPGCLLRPKTDKTPKDVSNILDILYESNTGTYFDAYQAISKYLKDNKLASYILIGNHGKKSEYDNPILKEVLEKIVEKWPRPPKTISGRDLGGKNKKETIKYEKTINEKKKLIRFLRKANISFGQNQKQNRNIDILDTDIISFIPNYKDRTSLAKKILQNNTLTYNTTSKLYKPSSITNSKTYIYLDVSGSVLEDLKKMIPLLIKPYKNNECSIFTFSTEVYSTTPQKIINGQIETTHGTDINCIFKHYFSINKNKRPHKIVILTDGYTGWCSNYYINLINKHKLKIYTGLFGKDKLKNELINITTHFEEFNI